MPASNHSRPSRVSRQRLPSGDLDRWLARGIDASLAALVFVAPCFMGGRHPLGQWVVMALTILLAALWLASQWRAPSAHWLHSPAQWILLAALALVTLQVTPLPEAWLAMLSPGLHDLLPLWSEHGEAALKLGAWSTLSLTPEATRDGLALLAVYALLFTIVTQRMRQLEDVERLIQWVAWATIAMAVFGLLQYLAGNEKFFWIYRHPFMVTSDAVRGSFTNRNHFAHFMALGLGPLLWCVHRSLPKLPSRFANTFARGSRRTEPWTLRAAWIWLALGVVLFAALLSFSRGGAIALLVAAGVFVGIGYRASLLGKRMVVSLGAITLLVGAFLLVHGYQSVVGRLDDLASGSLEQLDQHQGRRLIWGAVVQAIADSPWLGSGVGSHAEVYPKYLTVAGSREYTHAENGYLQIAEETGLAGVLLLLACLALGVAWCRQTLKQAASPRHLACLAAVAASLAASCVHSCGDFVWHVPACVVVVALLAPCAFHLARMTPEGISPSTGAGRLPRLVWPLASLATLAVGWLALQQQLGSVWAQTHWDHYHLARRQHDDPQDVAELKLSELEAIVRHNPSDARAHLGLVEAHLRQFDREQLEAEDSMSLTSIRDAAHSSDFASQADLDAWLSRAIGPRKVHLDRALWHSRRALTLCPLHGPGYVYLSELAFLELGDPQLAAACIAQALAVRPHDGSVLFKAGEEALLAGDLAGAVGYWQRACRADPAIETQLVDFAASRGIPLMFFVEQLQPELRACRLLNGRYRSITPPAEFQQFIVHYLRAAESAAKEASGPAAGALWLEAHRFCNEIADAQRARHAVQQALEADPNSIEVHRSMGDCLMQRQQFKEAEEHFKWCLLRQPNDHYLLTHAEAATKKRIDAQTQQSSRGTPPSPPRR